jgi:glycosyltransferase involved in cell wall biosynthesis
VVLQRTMSGFRIAMVSARYPPSLGGVETHVNEVARRIAARGLDLTVLTADETGTLPEVERDGPLTVRRFRAWPRRTDLYLSPTLLKEIRRGGYDLVHVQGVHTALPPMALAAAQGSGVLTALTFHTGGHSSRVRTMVRETQWRALRPMLRRTDALIGVSQFEVDAFTRRLGLEPGAIRLIRNGAEALPVGASPPNISGSPLVCSVARLERYKGHHRLIEAMPALLDLRPDAHLAVVGRGSFEGNLHRLASRLRVEHAVTFVSFETSQREELGALLQSSQVVALLSEYEAHPVAILEALALGRKVVVADTSGLSELASEELVTAVPLNAAPRTLARVLAQVAARPDSVTPELPTWDDCANQLLRLYEELLRAAPRRQPSSMFHKRSKSSRA